MSKLNSVKTELAAALQRRCFVLTESHTTYHPQMGPIGDGVTKTVWSHQASGLFVSHFSDNDSVSVGAMTPDGMLTLISRSAYWGENLSAIFGFLDSSKIKWDQKPQSPHQALRGKLPEN